LGPYGVNFSAEGTYIVVEGYEFSAVLARVLVTWHLFVSFAPFFGVIYAFSVEG
jgi:hypothetical protein